MGRVHALLLYFLPPDPQPVPASPSADSRAALLSSLSSEPLLRLGYNACVRKSEKPWGFVSKVGIYDIIALEHAAKQEGEDEKSKKLWTFRRTDNLRLWAGLEGTVHDAHPAALTADLSTITTTYAYSFHFCYKYSTALPWRVSATFPFGQGRSRTTHITYLMQELWRRKMRVRKIYWKLPSPDGWTRWSLSQGVLLINGQSFRPTPRFQIARRTYHGLFSPIFGSIPSRILELSCSRLSTRSLFYVSRSHPIPHKRVTPIFDPMQRASSLPRLSYTPTSRTYIPDNLSHYLFPPFIFQIPAPPVT